MITAWITLGGKSIAVPYHEYRTLDYTAKPVDSSLANELYNIPHEEIKHSWMMFTQRQTEIRHSWMSGKCNV